MKKNRIILGMLHSLSTVGFSILLLFSLWQLGCDLFTANGKVGSTEVSSHHSKGYPLSFSSHLSIPDSTIQYAGVTNYYRDHKYDEKRSKVLKDFHSKRVISPETKREITVNRIGTYEDIINTGNNISFIPLEEQQIQIYPETRINCSFNIKSSNFYINSLLILKNYLTLLAYTLIFYQLMKIFKQLLRNFSFIPITSKRVNFIGLILIVSEFSKLLFSFYIGRNIQFLQILSIENNISIKQNYDMYFNPKLDFDFTYFIIGLSLLILSSLLKMANKLEQENNLTI